MSHGPSRQLFTEFASVPDNVILLTGRGEERTLARSLFDKWNGAQRAEDKWDKGKIGRNVMLDGSVKIRLNRKVPLEGAELEAFEAKERAAKEKEAAQQAAMARTQVMLEADEDDSDSDSESDSDEGEDNDAMDIGAEGRLTRRPKREKLDQLDNDWMDEDGPKQMLSFDIYLKGNVSKSVSFFKSAGQAPRFRMFPYVEKKRRVDDYGETIDVGMWLRKGKALEEETESEEMKARRLMAEEDAKVSIAFLLCPCTDILVESYQRGSLQVYFQPS